ncbi:MAG TPA: hypothetical protein VFM14_09920 [Gemmatimonadales bacterium]|nr:hypothetical protein [Gemmatimonadales bacterium]
MTYDRSTQLRVIAIVIAALTTEAAARAGLWLLETRDIEYEPLVESLGPGQRDALEKIVSGTSRMLMFDAELGWTIRPGGEHPPLYRANSQGVRADREFAPEPPAGVVRVAAFGDSFTHGDDVSNQDTWTALLQTPSREVLNFGVPAYGLDQAYLRYRRDGRQYRAHFVLIGFMSHDIVRSVSVYRPFHFPTTSVPLSKPRFQIEEDSLALITNPIRNVQQYRTLLDSPTALLPRLGAADYFYRTRERAGALDVLAAVRLGKLAVGVIRRANGPHRQGYFNPGSEAFRVTLATMDRFVRDVRADGATPLIVLFPPRDDLQRYWQNHTRSYDPLRAALDSAGLPYVDVMDAFEGCSPRYVRQLVKGHYTPIGNARVAAFLSERLPGAPPYTGTSRNRPGCGASPP